MRQTPPLPHGRGSDIAAQPVQGKNPAVFTYQILQPTWIATMVVKMVFYSGGEVVALSGVGVEGGVLCE